MQNLFFVCLFLNHNEFLFFATEVFFFFHFKVFILSPFNPQVVSMITQNITFQVALRGAMQS